MSVYLWFVNATSLDNTAQQTQQPKLRLNKQTENHMVAVMPANYTVIAFNQ
jgi:hypothetical protein